MKFLFKQILVFATIFFFTEINARKYLAIRKKSILDQFVDKNNERKFLSKETIKDNVNLIVILCPLIVTGGPEDLSQLYYELKKLGFEVYFLWTEHLFQVKTKYEKGIHYLCKDDKNIINNAYVKKYEVNCLSRDIPLIDTTLIIVPEIWADAIALFGKAQAAIYWLSIGNLIGYDTRLVSQLIKINSMQYVNCIHFVTCHYARKVLEGWGLSSIMLGQYMPSLYFSNSLVSKIENSIVFFPRKAKELGERFVHQYPYFNYIRLENLDEQGVVNALDSAKIYIDFGHFPGPERVPREALMRNCIIFIHNVGAATDFETYPIDDYFRFSDSDVTDGTLYKKVCEVLADYENMKEKQDYKRNLTREEYSIFQQRVNDVFGKPCK